jgi:hypothetical protein
VCIFECNIRSDICCECCSVFKNAGLRFPCTQIWVKIFPFCVLVHILLSWRISAYKKVVYRTKHMLWLMLFQEWYFMTIRKTYTDVCTVCDITCTMMARDFYYRSVVLCDTRWILSLTPSVPALHVWVGSVEVQDQGSFLCID